jgi:uncharacterized membrane protein YtjA (UPF0391 family)
MIQPKFLVSLDRSSFNADPAKKLNPKRIPASKLIKEVSTMLRWAVIFLIIALVAALFGFTGIAAAAAGIAKFLFFLFLVMCIIFFIIGISVGRKVL